MRRDLVPRAVQPGLAAAFERAKEKVSEREFLDRVEAARREFDGLLDDEALGLLVLDELGLNEGAFVEIADLPGRAEASLRVVVERVEGVREFQREGRPPGRVANCVVTDGSGEARLVLWDRDAEKAEDGTLREGARVTLVGARVKESRFGVELHVTPWTALEVEGALDAAKRKLLMDVSGEGDPLALALRGEEEGVQRAFQTRLVDAPGPMRGTIASVATTRPFKRSDGSVGFACDVEVDTPDGRVKVVCWDDAVKAIRAIPVGGDVVLDKLVAKARVGGPEWHTTKETRIKTA